MFGRRWALMRKALLAAVVIGALATQLEPTRSPYIRAVLDDKSGGQVAVIENARPAPPTPAVLTKAITSTDSESTSRNQPRVLSEPNQNATDTAARPRNTGGRRTRADPDGASVWVRVNGSVVNVRSGPTSSAQRIGSFPEGTRLRVLERDGRWTKIEDPESGQSGWMFRDFLARVSDGGEPSS